MGGAVTLAALLAAPAEADALPQEEWAGVIAAARAEQLLGALACRLSGIAVPERVGAILHDARDMAAESRRAALWEAEMARRMLAPLGVPVVLLKGTAFVAGGLAAGQGRMIGDLDVLVPRAALADVERALLATGWEWAKPDAYDDGYYRRWMHELPPLLHRDRDRLIDVHHTILPPTARITPDADALLAGARPLGNGLSIPAPEDMVVHAAIHLLADGDLAGGLRNLWDIDRLLFEFGEEDGAFWSRLRARAALHQAGGVVARAVRLSHALFATAVPDDWRGLRAGDAWFRRRLLARDEWGRETRAATRAAFYVRSHWMRMPPPLLARHLAIKAWKRVAPARS